MGIKSLKMIGVYKITNPIGQVYVGSSVNVERHWNIHKGMGRKSHRKLIDSLDKYGVENHVFEVVVECNESELRELETKIGLELGALDTEKGLNLMLPKLKNGLGGCSEDKISWNRGIPMREDAKEKMRLKKIGIPSWNKGKKWSEESKRKMSESSKGRVAWNKGKKGLQKAWNRKLVLDLQTGIFYSSCTEASKIFGYPRTTLQAMLDGQNPNKTNLIYV